MPIVEGYATESVAYAGAVAAPATARGPGRADGRHPTGAIGRPRGTGHLLERLPVSGRKAVCLSKAGKILG